MALTKQQSRVYSFLETYLRRKGRPPSYQEIQDYFGFRSLNSVVKHLKQLERKPARLYHPRLSRYLETSGE